MLRVVLVCALLALVKAQTTNVQQCTLNDAAQPINAYVQGCASTPCTIQSGVDVIITMIFKAPHLIQSMRTLVMVELPFIGALPFELGDYGITCNFLANSYCPILPGEILQYTLNFNIPSFAAGNAATIEFSVVDENQKYITCIRLPVSVV